jgi:hypothetical protein
MVVVPYPRLSEMSSSLGDPACCWRCVWAIGGPNPRERGDDRASRVAACPRAFGPDLRHIWGAGTTETEDDAGQPIAQVDYVTRCVRCGQWKGVGV